MTTRNISLIISLFALTACGSEGFLEEEARIIDEAINIVVDKLSAKEVSTEYIVTRADVVGQDIIIDGEQLASTTIDEFGIEIFEIPEGMDRDDLVRELRDSNRFEYVEDTEDFQLDMEDRIFDVMEASSIEFISGEAQDFALQARFDSESSELEVRHFAQDIVSATLCSVDSEDGDKRCMTMAPSDIPGMSVLSLDSVSSGYFTLSMTDFDGITRHFGDLSIEESNIWQDILRCKSTVEVSDFRFNSSEEIIEVGYSSEEVVGLTVCSQDKYGFNTCKESWGEGEAYFSMTSVGDDFSIGLRDIDGCKVDFRAEGVGTP